MGKALDVRKTIPDLQIVLHPLDTRPVICEVFDLGNGKTDVQFTPGSHLDLIALRVTLENLMPVIQAAATVRRLDEENEKFRRSLEDDKGLPF